MNSVKQDVEKLVQKELESVSQKFPVFRSDYEGAAVIYGAIEEAESEMRGVHRYFAGAWYSVRANERLKLYQDINRIERRDGTQRILEAAMDIAQPMRKHGIYSEQTTEMLRAQDIWQVIRHQLWVDRHGDEDSWCVDSHEPMCMSGEALPKMRGVEE